MMSEEPVTYGSGVYYLFLLRRKQHEQKEAYTHFGSSYDRVYAPYHLGDSDMPYHIQISDEPSGGAGLSEAVCGG